MSACPVTSAFSSVSSVDSLTSRCASWLTSAGLFGLFLGAFLGLLVRFGIYAICHSERCKSRSILFQSSPLPNFADVCHSSNRLGVLSRKTRTNNDRKFDHVVGFNKTGMVVVSRFAVAMFVPRL